MLDCEISFDRLRIDFVSAARLLSETYWGKGRGEGEQLEAFSNSICAAAFHQGRQIGFARAVSDRVFFARLSDVIVWPDFRGQGVATRLTRALLDHPELTRVSTWTLNTRDAHGIYERLGFQRCADGNDMRLERRTRP